MYYKIKNNKIFIIKQILSKDLGYKFLLINQSIIINQKHFILSIFEYNKYNKIKYSNFDLNYILDMIDYPLYFNYIYLYSIYTKKLSQLCINLITWGY